MWISVIRGLSHRTESAPQFEEVIPAEIGKKMRRRKLIGTRKALRRTDWRAAGFEVYLLGDGKNKE